MVSLGRRSKRNQLASDERGSAKDRANSTHLLAPSQNARESAAGPVPGPGFALRSFGYVNRKF
jgi:hypothetical protein